MRGAGFAAFGIVWFGIFALSIFGLVFWILKLVEVVRVPDQQFRNAGTEKVTWVLVVALAGWLGALIWHVAKRTDVLNAPAGYAASGPTAPPPGWYPDGRQPGLRWWDGRAWTEHRHG